MNQIANPPSFEESPLYVLGIGFKELIFSCLPSQDRTQVLVILRGINSFCLCGITFKIFAIFLYIDFWCGQDSLLKVANEFPILGIFRLFFDIYLHPLWHDIFSFPWSFLSLESNCFKTPETVSICIKLW